MAFTSEVDTVALSTQDNVSLETGGNLASVQQSLLSMNELMQELIMEVRAMRLAVAQIATEGGRCKEADFDPQYQNFQSQTLGE